MSGNQKQRAIPTQRNSGFSFQALFSIAVILIFIGLIPLMFFGGTFFTTFCLSVGGVLLLWLTLAPRPLLSPPKFPVILGSSIIILLCIVFYAPTPIPRMFSLSSIAWLHMLLICSILFSYWFIENKRLFYMGVCSAIFLTGYLFVSRVPLFLHLGLVTLLVTLVTVLWLLYFKSKVKLLSIQHFYLITLTFAFIFLILLQSAWLCDDAFITFRTIENFLHGYGLRWNIAERVQTYTHPLYMLCLSIIVFLTHEYYYTTLLLNIILACMAIFLMIRYISPTPLGAILAIITLSFSKAFIDYSTSGLENSLTFLFIAAFVSFTKTSFSSDKKKHLMLGLMAGLCTFNRLDTLLFFIPTLGWFLWKTSPHSRLKTAYYLSLGFIPLLAWEAFSILYYGFPFPNTAYAKLYLPFSSFSQIFNQGFDYYLNSLILDPISLIMISLAIGSTFLSPAGSNNLPLAFGLFFYLAYTLKIGGDFMSGRFLAAPFFLSTLIFFSTFQPQKKHGIIIFFFILTLSTITPFNPWHTDKNYSGVVSSHFITDERQFYYQSTGLLRAKPDQTLNGDDNHQTTRRKNAAEFSKKTRRTTVHIAMGVLGFYAGPNVYIVDEVALCDPLLARIPSWCKEFCPGHMIRKIPNGYLRSINTDSNQLTNPHLHQIYDALRLVTRAPLFSVERFQAILKLNLGTYNSSQHLGFFHSPRPHKPLPFDLGNDPYSNLIRQAQTYIDDCDYLKLEDCLLEAQTLDPKRPEARIYLGILYEYLGELDMAAKQFQYFVNRQDITWNHFYPELLRDIAKEAQP